MTEQWLHATLAYALSAIIRLWFQYVDPPIQPSVGGLKQTR